MTGKNIGVISFFQTAYYDRVTFTHCLIHGETIASKKLGSKLNNELRDAVKFINIIKCQTLNNRSFSNHCKDAVSNQQLYYCVQK